MNEKLILGNIFHNETYGRKVLPYLKEEYFTDQNDRTIFLLIDNYVKKYNTFPTRTSLEVELDSLPLSQENFKECHQIITSLKASDNKELPWLLEKTETFCQDRAIYNALQKSIEILDGDKSANLSKGAIPHLMEQALAVSFDSHIGHDYIDNAPHRYEYYRIKEFKVPFDLEYFNKITKGGFSRKTLNILLAGTGVGKSLVMCHMAAANLMANQNVLYITMEMAEEKIAERIDANLLDIPISEMETVPQEMYERRISRLKEKVKGKLIIKEYPTASASVAHIRTLLSELNLKKKFKPDIIYIDYLNICMSSRLKYGANINSYTYIKSIAEEIRGLAIEENVPIVSATQTTRGGYGNSDVGLEDTSESFGLPQTADFMCAIISTEELEDFNQFLVKQLKNRYTNLAMCRRFLIGVDKMKMRLYDVEQDAHDDIHDGPKKDQDDKSVFDNSDFGEEDNERSKPKPKKKPPKGFK